MASIFDGIKLNQSHVLAHTHILGKRVHDKIPQSSCLGCPMAGGIGHDVVAECCHKASPPLYAIEFIYAYQHIEKTWTKERRKELIYKCFEAILNRASEKPCVLLDQLNNKCGIYKYRWTGCRTYGMIPDTQWVNRAKGWIKELIAPNFIEKKMVKEKKPTKLEGADLFIQVERDVVNEKKLDKYIDEELFADGFNPDKINETLANKWNIEHFKVYEQCKNLKLKRPFLEADLVDKDLRKIEKSFVGYDIDQDEYNTSYLAFHVYLLLFTIGEDRVNYLLEIKDKWDNEQKDKFLEDIKVSIDSMVIDNKVAKESTMYKTSGKKK